MSFLTKLIIDREEFTVLKAKYRISQADDETGLPVERTKAGKLFLTVESVKNTEVISWAMSNRALKDGELIFYNRDAISVFRKVEFKKAYCLEFEEIFDAIDTNPLMSKIVISAKELVIRDAKHENNWPSIG